MFTPGTPIAISDDVTLNFPESFCCNCGVEHGLAIVEQDTRFTRFMGGGGSEYTFRLPLPFCKECKPSARRRAPTRFKILLVAGLAYVLCLLASVFIGLGTGSEWFLESSFAISAVVALASVFGWYLTRRPNPPLTSYYQPVRLLKLKQKFVSGMVTSMTIGFTSSAYSRAFAALNEPSIASGALTVKEL